jgi:APA family basic amino acid/polyamine antiporter
MQEKKKIGWFSASSLVVANMIGTGVFTTLGFQLENIQNSWSVLALWSLGGLISLFGAFSYAELGTHLPRSGGEYHFLSKLYHPFLGYLSGWVSLTVGFAAPVALAAMALGAYTYRFLPMSPVWIAGITVLVLSLVHSYNLRQSSTFQNSFTLAKIILIIILVVLGFTWPSKGNALDWSEGWLLEWSSPAFAVSLVYVTYAYSGWNAAAYIVDEIDEPSRNLPRALIGGTILVSLLYVLIQFAFLSQSPLELLVGKVEVGQVVAGQMFGLEGGRVISGVIAFFLISGISAMIWVGPRVTHTMASDYPLWSFLANENARGIPVRAIWLQTLISLIMIFTGSFEQILLYSGFVLQLFTTLTVAGLFILRAQEKNSSAYRSPFFPVFQIIFLFVSCWVLFFMLYDKPAESLLGLANLGIGALSYTVGKKGRRNQ